MREEEKERWRRREEGGGGSRRAKPPPKMAPSSCMATKAAKVRTEKASFILWPSAASRWRTSTPTETAGLKWPPEVAPAADSCERSTPPMAKAARPVTLEAAVARATVKARKKVPTNSTVKGATSLRTSTHMLSIACHMRKVLA